MSEGEISFGIGIVLRYLCGAWDEGSPLIGGPFHGTHTDRSTCSTTIVRYEIDAPRSLLVPICAVTYRTHVYRRREIWRYGSVWRAEYIHAEP
jgi:hypothetical protein